MGVGRVLRENSSEERVVSVESQARTPTATFTFDERVAVEAPRMLKGLGSEESRL